MCETTDLSNGETDIESSLESELLALLANERRRQLLAVLEESEAPVDCETLARRVAERESELDRPSPRHSDRVAITLWHNHLPKLDEAGLVRFDPDRRTVTPMTARLDALPVDPERWTEDPD